MIDTDARAQEIVEESKRKSAKLKDKLDDERARLNMKNEETLKAEQARIAEESKEELSKFRKKKEELAEQRIKAIDSINISGIVAEAFKAYMDETCS